MNCYFKDLADKCSEQPGTPRAHIERIHKQRTITRKHKLSTGESWLVNHEATIERCFQEVEKKIRQPERAVGDKPSFRWNPNCHLKHIVLFSTGTRFGNCFTQKHSFAESSPVCWNALGSQIPGLSGSRGPKRKMQGI